MKQMCQKNHTLSLHKFIMQFIYSRHNVSCLGCKILPLFGSNKCLHEILHARIVKKWFTGSQHKSKKYILNKAAQGTKLYCISCLYITFM